MGIHAEKTEIFNGKKRLDDMTSIALIGSSQLSERLIYYFEETGFGTVAGMFDDYLAPDTIVYDRPILGKVSDVPERFRDGAFDRMAVAIGYKHLPYRKKVYEFISGQGIPVVTFVHPSSFVDTSATINPGAIILTCCTVEMRATVGENVLLSSRSFVSHHVRVGAHTYCGPAIHLAGNSVIGECCFLGINTTVSDHVTVSDNVVCAAGSVIMKDVPPRVMVAGVPAQIKKQLSGEQP
ncbi:acetyltransferase [Candidatus Latescibacterota bacterium]